MEVLASCSSPHKPAGQRKTVLFFCRFMSDIQLPFARINKSALSWRFSLRLFVAILEQETNSNSLALQERYVRRSLARN